MRFPGFALLPLLLVMIGCSSGLPDTGSEAYQQVVTSFYSGVAAVQSGSDLGAEERFVRVTELAPGEPAAWANLGLLALRQNEIERATSLFGEAEKLAPDDAELLLLLGQKARVEGDLDAATQYLEAAVAADATNLKARYALALIRESQGASADAHALLLEALSLDRQNTALLLEALRLAALNGSFDALETVETSLAAQVGEWPPEAQQQWVGVVEALRAQDAGVLATQAAFLKNVLLRLPDFRRNLRALQTPPEEIGDLMTRFLRLAPPASRVFAPDDSLIFEPEEVPVSPGAWTAAYVQFLREEGAPDILLASTAQVQIVGREALDFPGGESEPGQHAMLGLDYNYDFWMDLAFAGAGGFKLYRQDSTEVFVDVTSSLGLARATVQAAYQGLWIADLDMEGDIDIILGRAGEAPLVLRNNGDGTFAAQVVFEDPIGLVDFAWADVDHDGDADAVIIDENGTLLVYANERNGRFVLRDLPVELGTAAALAVTDIDAEGRLDILAWTTDGTLVQLTDRDGFDWTLQALATWEGQAPEPGQARLFAADLDNNGRFDLVAATKEQWQLWLGGAPQGFVSLGQPRPGHLFSLAELSGDGRLDPLTIAADGAVVQHINFGVKPYHFKRLRMRAATTLGDQRINSFGIGGEVELRAGLLYQKQAIQDPIVHFGLGEDRVADLARIVWPNGSVQAEFDLLSDQLISAQQRLKGSCPWLFTYNGETMTFVTDFIWRSPLGLRINAQETAGIMTTEDWVKIRGDQLVPREGRYDVRITADLWETHFFDHVSLMVVDHPVGTEMFVDERFAMPPPAFSVNLTSTLRDIESATSDTGEDLTPLLTERDGHYADYFGRGAYQGITRPHFVEVDLGEVPTAASLLLVAQGWVRPTDSSINVAIGQGTQAKPQGLRVEVSDGQGGWKTWHEDLGFPSGKKKTILIDLAGAFEEEHAARVRLHTNLEIYWDALHWATRVQGDAETNVRVASLLADKAELRYRGYSAVAEANRSSPELPDYSTLMATTQIWRDLEGYYTRHGAVEELLEGVDDRYVIMNAGDELRFQFAAPPPPPEGWTRDFILVGDGWVKDGDYNTSFSRTVLPLPSHDQPNYERAPTRLEDDPVYLRHAADWQTYHTRYIAPDAFRQGLRISP